MEKLCDCTDTCVRCFHWSDGSGGAICPYVPKGFEGHDITCKWLTDKSIKASIKDPPSRSPINQEPV